MSERNAQQGYSNIIFYSFAISFFILSIINIRHPLGNFRMTILSMVAMLFSLQQWAETVEEARNKVTDLEKKLDRQDIVLDMMTSSTKPFPKRQECKPRKFVISQLIFAAAMILLIVGLAIDVPFQNGILANTMTVASFSVIFCTMGLKERLLAKISNLHSELYEGDQRIIDVLINRIGTLEDEKGISPNLRLIPSKEKETKPNDGENK